MTRLTQIFNALAKETGGQVTSFRQTEYLADVIPGRGGHCTALTIAWLARHDIAPARDPFGGRAFTSLVSDSPRAFSSFLRQVQNSEASRAMIFRNITSGPRTPEREQDVAELDMATSPSALLREYIGAFGGVPHNVGRPIRYEPPYYELATAALSDDGRYTINTHNHALALIVQGGQAWFFDPNCGIVHFGPAAGATARGPGTSPLVLAARFLREYLNTPYIAEFYRATDGVWLVTATPSGPPPAAAPVVSAAAAPPGSTPSAARWPK